MARPSTSSPPRRARRGGIDPAAPSATERAEEALRASVLQAQTIASEREEQASSARARQAATAAGETYEETDDEKLARLRRDALSAPAASTGMQRQLRLGVAFWISLGWIGLVVFGAIFFPFLHLKSPTLPLQGPFDVGPSWH
ncbi:MAG TPA: hypothetical protein VGP46_02490, partial [Acidimicrobiales bacterium]|nr:hypothetical protein [Acidimicrobiales bacterium]